MGLPAVAETSPAIYSFTALRSNQREVKDRALREVVHITENGNGAFVFCSEEIFQRKLEEAARDAVREVEITRIAMQGMREIDEGHYIDGTTEALALLENIWAGE